ncbi:Hpt domain-containing protein [Salibacter sp.]|uniref:Hpt domain-containing protein n=1 Tax=Salibacter sp. TaxID=2010995 RepID=UPI00287020CD|nr:Hpt domain-containing protein [Salibacter sp.]MDR9398274.1 Hpt domain-containing protein [Salibacter sp.]MDR9487716.1 Hpt domain-containing protein [Salibacter sp.]
MSNELYDIEQLKMATGNDPDFTNHMIKVFLEEAPKLFDKLSNHFEVNDPKGVRFIAHQLKGNFKAMGIHSWEDLRAIELAAKEEELGKIETEMESVQEKFPKIIESLKREL